MAKITLVDDDENICSAFRQFLEADGHSPIIASNAEDALKAVQERHPDLVFLDVRMPGMSGLELQRQIAAANWRIPIIFVTSHADGDEQAQALEAGAVDYLYKPFREEDLINAIDVALKHS